MFGLLSYTIKGKLEKSFNEMDVILTETYMKIKKEKRTF